MTIEECKQRKRKFGKIRYKLQNQEYSKLSASDYELLELAVARSIACEQLNINDLKKREVEHVS